MSSSARTVSPLFTLLVALLVLGAGASSAEETPHWGYNCAEGAPFEWGLLDGRFTRCLVGLAQSPIPISTAGSIHTSLPPLQFEDQTADLLVKNDGHTVEAFIQGGPGGELGVGSRLYELQRFHWHTPSEHWIDGNVFPMELHMVHVAPGGASLVVGVMILNGRNNGELDKIWNVLPQNSGEEVPVAGFDPSKLLPASRESYRYNGSLTTPPCGQGIRWVVLAEPVEMSPQQIAKFQTLFYGNARFPVGNARPPQPRNNRRVVTDATAGQ